MIKYKSIQSDWEAYLSSTTYGSEQIHESLDIGKTILNSYRVNQMWFLCWTSFKLLHTCWLFWKISLANIHSAKKHSFMLPYGHVERNKNIISKKSFLYCKSDGFPNVDRCNRPWEKQYCAPYSNRSQQRLSLRFSFNYWPGVMSVGKFY